MQVRRAVIAIEQFTKRSAIGVLAPSAFVAMDVGCLLCDRFFRFVRIAVSPLRIDLTTRMAVCGVRVAHERRHKNDNHLSYLT
jgi:hypothetical protein